MEASWFSTKAFSASVEISCSTEAFSISFEVGLDQNQVHQVPNQEPVSAKITKAST